MSAPWPASSLAVGTFVKLPTPEVIEVLALSGLDFVVIDNEHASIGPQVVSTMVAVARGCGIDAFVRVAGLTAGDVQPPLDAGARGLFLPRVDDVATARAAVGACRFPPLGHRGASPSGRAGGWGTDDLSTYVARGASDVTLVAQLESVAALRAAGEIVAVPGIDALFVGPADLAVSAGRALDDPVLQELIQDARAAVQRSGTPLGTTAPPAIPGGPVDPRGLRFLTLSTDAGLLAAGARGAVRAVLAQPAEGASA